MNRIYLMFLLIFSLKNTHASLSEIDMKSFEEVQSTSSSSSLCFMSSTESPCLEEGSLMSTSEMGSEITAFSKTKSSDDEVIEIFSLNSEEESSIQNDPVLEKKIPLSISIKDYAPVSFFSLADYHYKKISKHQKNLIKKYKSCFSNFNSINTKMAGRLKWHKSKYDDVMNFDSLYVDYETRFKTFTKSLEEIPAYGPNISIVDILYGLFAVNASYKKAFFPFQTRGFYEHFDFYHQFLSWKNSNGESSKEHLKEISCQIRTFKKREKKIKRAKEKFNEHARFLFSFAKDNFYTGSYYDKFGSYSLFRDIDGVLDENNQKIRPCITSNHSFMKDKSTPMISLSLRNIRFLDFNTAVLYKSAKAITAFSDIFNLSYSKIIIDIMDIRYPHYNNPKRFKPHLSFKCPLNDEKSIDCDLCCDLLSYSQKISKYKEEKQFRKIENHDALNIEKALREKAECLINFIEKSLLGNDKMEPEEAKLLVEVYVKSMKIADSYIRVPFN